MTKKENELKTKAMTKRIREELIYAGVFDAHELDGDIEPSGNIVDGPGFCFAFKYDSAIWHVEVAGPPDCDCEDADEDEPTYRIERVFQVDGRHEIIKTGLTLQEAEDHCSDPNTSGGEWPDVWMDVRYPEDAE